MADLLDYVEAGKGGDVAPRGSGAGHWLFEIDLDAVANGDILTGFVPGFKGKIISVDAYVVIAVSTANDKSTFNLEIDGVNVTGGAVTPDSTSASNCDTLGQKVAGSAVTGANAFGKASLIDIEAASTTDFAEGRIFLDVAYVVLGS